MHQLSHSHRQGTIVLYYFIGFGQDRVNFLHRTLYRLGSPPYFKMLSCNPLQWTTEPLQGYGKFLGLEHFPIS